MALTLDKQDLIVVLVISLVKFVPFSTGYISLYDENIFTSLQNLYKIELSLLKYIFIFGFVGILERNIFLFHFKIKSPDV